MNEAASLRDLVSDSEGFGVIQLWGNNVGNGIQFTEDGEDFYLKSMVTGEDDPPGVPYLQDTGTFGVNSVLRERFDTEITIDDFRMHPGKAFALASLAIWSQDIDQPPNLSEVRRDLNIVQESIPIDEVCTNPEKFFEDAEKVIEEFSLM